MNEVSLDRTYFGSTIIGELKPRCVKALSEARLYHLDSVRRLRNAAAHNTCMISNLKPQNWFKSDIEINPILGYAGVGYRF